MYFQQRDGQLSTQDPSHASYLEVSPTELSETDFKDCSASPGAELALFSLGKFSLLLDLLFSTHLGGQENNKFDPCRVAALESHYWE